MSESSGQIKQFVKSCGRRDIKRKVCILRTYILFPAIKGNIGRNSKKLKIASEVIEILNEVLRMLWMYGIPIDLDES